MSKHVYNYVTIKSLDGVEVEVTHSDAGRPPGDVGGQHLNTTAVWIRPLNGVWVRSPHRSAIKVADMIVSHNILDLIDIFLKETGYETKGSKTSGSGSSTSLTTKFQSLQGHSVGDVNKGPTGDNKA